MTDNTILISVVDTTGCVLRIYQMELASSMKQLITHFKDFACPLCVRPENITFWYKDTQITTLHTPSTLELPPFAQITIKPSILCNTSTTTLGHPLPILHHFSQPLIRLRNETFTASPLGGTVFPFGPMGLYGYQEREAGWEAREELRRKLMDVKKLEQDLIRKIVVGRVYEKYAVNGQAVRERVGVLVEERCRVGERCRMVEEELEAEGRMSERE